MQQYGLFLTDANIQLYFSLERICRFEHRLHIPSIT